METINITETVSLRTDLPDEPIQIAHEFSLNGRIRRRRQLVDRTSLGYLFKIGALLSEAREEAAKGLPPALKPQFVHA